MNQILAPTSDFSADQYAIEAIQNDPTLAPSTKHQYIKAIHNYIATGQSLTDPVALSRYAGTVGSSTQAFLSAAVTRLAKELEQLAKGSATPVNIATAQAAVFRAQALQNAVKTEPSKGHKAHTWLSQKQVTELLEACKQRPRTGNPESKITTRRDRLAIGLMVAAGLRREEAVSLSFEDIKFQPVGDNIRTVLDVKGKGAKDRVVPISDRLAKAIEEWAGIAHAGREEYILRSLGRNKIPGDSISTTAVYDLVQKRGALIGKPNLQPHDLRRTYAQLGYEAGVPITQISILLGHASVETTQKYLNLDLDLNTTVSDFVPF